MCQTSAPRIDLPDMGGVIQTGFAESCAQFVEACKVSWLAVEDDSADDLSP
jgi:hypothetical protein